MTLESTLILEVGRRNRIGKRLVTIRDRHTKDEIYRDRIDTNSATSRKRLLKGVQDRITCERQVLEQLEKSLLVASDEADRRTVDSRAGEDSDSRPNSTELLLSLCNDLSLVYTDDSVTYAVLETKQNLQTLEIRRKPFRNWLTKEFYDRQSKAPPDQALQSAIDTLEAKASSEGTREQVYLRTCKIDDAIYIDLANDSWEVIKITAERWEVLSKSPVRFRRTASMKQLPMPERGGTLDELQKILNVDPPQWPLVAGWLLACFNTEIPYPVLCLTGEQGGAKSTTARILRAIVDPNVAPIRSAARNEQDLFVSANNNWVIAFDNISKLKQSISDALCRLSTGGGFSTRKLYADGDEVIFSARRPIILTGIEEVITQPDLLDRSLLVELKAIEPADRITERTFNQKFDEIYPRTLGAICDLLVIGLMNVNQITLASLPRMADFATWVVACSQTKRERDLFMSTYQKNRGRGDQIAIESEPLAVTLIEFTHSQDGSWSGTMTDLIGELKLFEPQLMKEPALKSPQSMSGFIKRLKPAFKAVGLLVDKSRQTRERIVSLQRITTF